MSESKELSTRFGI